MDDKYIALAKRILKTHEVSVEEKRFGIAVIKGNKPLRKDEEHCVDYTNGRGDRSFLYISGGTLHERVLIIRDDIPIRSHEETDREIVKNFGTEDINYVQPNGNRIIFPENAIWSVFQEAGFYHGFGIRRGKYGVLYVAKAIKHGFVEGN